MPGASIVLPPDFGVAECVKSPRDVGPIACHFGFKSRVHNLDPVVLGAFSKRLWTLFLPSMIGLLEKVDAAAATVVRVERRYELIVDRVDSR